VCRTLLSRVQVSKRVSDLILQNQSWYTLELQRVTELQDSLDDAHSVCIRGRSNPHCCTRSDGLIAVISVTPQNQQSQTLAYFPPLREPDYMQETDTRLRELLEEQDYPGAIQLGLACHRAASTFKHYQCISELSSKLQETLEMTEEQLDVALSRTCSSFDRSHYSRLQAAYGLLGKTQARYVRDKLTQGLQRVWQDIQKKLTEFLLACNMSGFKFNQFIQVLDVCVPSECFLSCLLDLCQAMWQTMCSYKAILAWHQDGDDSVGDGGQEGGGEAEGDGSFEARYVRDKLTQGLQRVWQDIQKKLTEFLLACNMSGFKSTSSYRCWTCWLVVLHLYRLFRGTSLGNCLPVPILSQCPVCHLSRSCLEELRMFLENESWELVPVRSSFSLLQLQEFCFLRQSLQGRPATVSPSSRLEARREERPCFLVSRNPFLIQQEEEEEDLFDPPPSSVSPLPFHVGSTLSSTALFVPSRLIHAFLECSGSAASLRHTRVRRGRHTFPVGKVPTSYLTSGLIVRLPKVVLRSETLCENCGFDTCVWGAPDMSAVVYVADALFQSDFRENSLSPKARTSVQKIQEDLILDGQGASDGRPGEEPPEAKVRPWAPPSLDSFGLGGTPLHPHASRHVAGKAFCRVEKQESWCFLNIHARKSIAPTMVLTDLSGTQTVSMSAELRQPAYMTVAARALDYDQVLSRMEKVRWDLHEIPAQHSPYVDILIRELQVFLMRLSEVAKLIPIPKEATAVLWEHCVRISNRTFIEGWVLAARRCTPEGRARMQLDYQQFVSKVEKLVELRPLPDRELVEAYVKAYYLT
ncbi:coiled-coil domain-containing protein, putative, partial [Ixodes scapularis]